MKVFVLIREDQNQHGYIDTSIVGIFRNEDLAKERDARERLRAREEGLVDSDII